MAALKITIFLFTIGLALAQDYEGSVPVEQEAPAYKRSCYVSTGVSFADYQEETKACQFRETVCQTKIEVNKGVILVYGECKEDWACEDNAKGNMRNCYTMLKTQRESKDLDQVCHFCCKGHLCNNRVYGKNQLKERQERPLE